MQADSVSLRGGEAGADPGSSRRKGYVPTRSPRGERGMCRPGLLEEKGACADPVPLRRGEACEPTRYLEERGGRCRPGLFEEKGACADPVPIGEGRHVPTRSPKVGGRHVPTR